MCYGKKNILYMCIMEWVLFNKEILAILKRGKGWMKGWCELGD